MKVQIGPISWFGADGETRSVFLMLENDKVVSMSKVMKGMSTPQGRIQISRGDTPIPPKIPDCRTCDSDESSMSKIQIAKPSDVPKYLGTRMGEAIGRRTGRKPCKTCKATEDVLDTIDRATRRMTRKVFGRMS